MLHGIFTVTDVVFFPPKKSAKKGNRRTDKLSPYGHLYSTSHWLCIINIVNKYRIFCCYCSWGFALFVKYTRTQIIIPCAFWNTVPWYILHGCIHQMLKGHCISQAKPCLATVHRANTLWGQVYIKSNRRIHNVIPLLGTWQNESFM